MGYCHVNAPLPYVKPSIGVSSLGMTESVLPLARLLTFKSTHPPTDVDVN